MLIMLLQVVEIYFFIFWRPRISFYFLPKNITKKKAKVSLVAETDETDKTSVALNKPDKRRS